MTVRAANAQKAVLQPAALQIVLELALHLPRQCQLTHRQVLYERRVVGVHSLIQKCLPGPVTRLLARTRSPRVLAYQ